MRIWLAVAAFGSTMIGGFATAQTPPTAAPPPAQPRGGGIMSRVDANGDGVITRDEYLAGVDRRFDRLDLNRDGALSADERPMHGRGMGGDAPPAPPGTDAGQPPAPNARPPMTREQFRAGALRRFDRMDLNHDGKLDQSELNARPPRGARARDDVPQTLPKPPTE